jgi:hypothetical protein
MNRTSLLVYTCPTETRIWYHVASPTHTLAFSDWDIGIRHYAVVCRAYCKDYALKLEVQLDSI